MGNVITRLKTKDAIEDEAELQDAIFAELDALWRRYQILKRTIRMPIEERDRKIMICFMSFPADLALMHDMPKEDYMAFMNEAFDVALKESTDDEEEDDDDDDKEPESSPTGGDVVPIKKEDA